MPDGSEGSTLVEPHLLPSDAHTKVRPKSVQINENRLVLHLFVEVQKHPRSRGPVANLQRLQKVPVAANVSPRLKDSAKRVLQAFCVPCLPPNLDVGEHAENRTAPIRSSQVWVRSSPRSPFCGKPCGMSRTKSTHILLGARYPARILAIGSTYVAIPSSIQWWFPRPRGKPDEPSRELMSGPRQTPWQKFRFRLGW